MQSIQTPLSCVRLDRHGALLCFLSKYDTVKHAHKSIVLRVPPGRGAPTGTPLKAPDYGDPVMFGLDRRDFPLAKWRSLLSDCT